MRTLTSSREIDALFKNGRRGNAALLVVLCSPTPAGRDQHGRVLFVAGKKLGGAVARNRSKRVLREAVRRFGGRWPGLDIAVLARRGVATASPAEIDAALAEALRRAGAVG